MRLTLIGIIILLAFGCKKKTNTDYIYYQPYKQDSIRIADSLAIADSTMQAQLAAEKLQQQKQKMAKINRGVNLNNKYYIVIASYTVKTFAYEMKGKMIQEGYNADIFMTNEDGWYKLAIESYNDIQLARASIVSIKQKGGIFENAIIVAK